MRHEIPPKTVGIFFMHSVNLVVREHDWGKGAK